MLSDLWICAVEQSHSGNLRAGRSQGTCFWSQPQGPRQGISLTCRIISSLVGTHIISHLGDFLAFMLHLHSIRESKSSSTISSAQIWTQDSLHVSKFTLTSQRNNFQSSQINQKCFQRDAEMLSCKCSQVNYRCENVSIHLQEGEKPVWQRFPFIYNINIYIYICHWYSWLS